jgi:ABC-type transport system involved in cytochrome c biogenesis ATPase subunit
MKLVGVRRFQLNKVDLLKAGRFLLVALAGALLTAITVWLSDSGFTVMVAGKELDLTVLLVAFWSTIAEVLRRFLTNYETTIKTGKNK